MRDSSWPAVVELDVAVYRALRQRVIDLEAALSEERQRFDDFEAAGTARTDAPANRILTPRPRNTDPADARGRQSVFGHR